MSEGAPVLELRGLVRTFHQGTTDIAVLRGVDLTVKPGEVVALTGASGTGKSTLLQIAGLLERPDSGEVIVEGEHCANASDRRRTQLRGKKLGFVYQFHHLLPEFSALENIVMPQMITGVSRGAARQRARELLGQLGLADRENHRPGRLSGGEQQRVAIARALANGPTLLLADEPTGNLDQSTADHVFQSLMGMVRDSHLAALIATHNPALADTMDREITIADGALTNTR
ncbi:MAG: ABC transporter ATP-binding protein [Alphaproteobacteria bacterium]|jgi:lipoprotein-releasing system ATP-binding protein|nr:ABC transporter ATP-binding protein [Alphaproteobacteria bacterium]